MNKSKKRVFLIGFVFIFALSCFVYIKKNNNPICTNNSVSFILKNKNAFIQSLSGKKNIVPIMIIGSGPAGLSAAVYGARQSIDTLVFEGSQPGGQLMQTSYVENWPGKTKILGSEIISDIRSQAKSLGAHFMQDTVISIDTAEYPFKIKTVDQKEFYALSIIIATGSTPKKLNIEGEEKYWGIGVTTCAICDAPFFKNKNVVVVGGGDSAVEEAIQLAPYAKNITILVRKNKMRAAPTMQSRLKGYANIFIKYNTEVKKIMGNSNHVTNIDIYNNKDKRSENMAIDGVFLAIGHTPNTKLFNDIVAVNNNDYIKMENRSQKTSMPGIFAAGDVEDFKYRQAGVAASSGIKAALDAAEFLTHIGFDSYVVGKFKKNFFDVIATKKVSNLSSISNINELNKIIDQSNNNIIVLDFYTQYCPSCLQMLPKLASIAEDYKNKISIFKIDAEESLDLVEEFNVHKVPTLIVLKNKKEISRVKKAMNKKDLRLFIENIIKENNH